MRNWSVVMTHAWQCYYCWFSWPSYPIILAPTSKVASLFINGKLPHFLPVWLFAGSYNSHHAEMAPTDACFDKPIAVPFYTSEHTQRDVLSTLFRIHELTEAPHWPVSRWLRWEELISIQLSWSPSQCPDLISGHSLLLFNMLTCIKYCSYISLMNRESDPILLRAWPRIFTEILYWFLYTSLAKKYIIKSLNNVQ